MNRRELLKGLACLLCIGLFTGCTMKQVAQSAKRTESPATERSDPDVGNRTGDTAQSQQGGVNAAVGQATGVSFTKNQFFALPLGLALLLGFDKWMSHRREMARIKQNGKPK